MKMAAARPVVSVYSRDGKPTGDSVNLPAVFKVQFLSVEVLILKGADPD